MAKAKQVVVTEAAAPEGPEAAVVEAAPAAEVKLCACGCGLEVKPGRSWRQGHDARRKSVLIGFLEEGQGAMAEELLERRWMSQAEWDERLGRRVEERAAKAAKAKVKAEKQGRANAKAAKATATTESEAA